MAATTIRQGKDLYAGETKKHIRDGFGIYTYRNSFFRYEGEWKDGKKQGQGKLVLKDGGYYEGEFQDGEMTGNGIRFIAANGSTYMGQFYMGHFQGNGEMKYKDGGLYSGEWDSNQRSGNGTLQEAQGQTYLGNWHNNKRHEQGKQYYKDGSRYDGNWHNDKRHGQGELRCGDGSIFDGQWKNDVFHGFGMHISPSGMYFEGQWINGKPSEMAVKIVIKGASPRDAQSDQPFTIEIETHDANGNLVKDNGRKLELTAGVKYAPVTATPQSSIDLTSDDGVEDRLIPTELGYDLFPYPICNDTAFFEMYLKECEEEEPDPTVKGKAKPKERVKEEDTESGKDDQASIDGSLVEERKEYPRVATVTVEDGTVTVPNLFFAPPPPNYKPFAVPEEETPPTPVDRSKSRAAPGRRSEASINARTASKLSKRSSFEEKGVRAGEYVISVRDITQPPFLGFCLEPAYLIVRLLPSAAKKAKAAKKPKERGQSTSP